MLKTNESGRSMVEMLGVLAIIGVLSVGGIAGYTMAMRKYRVNEMLNAASMMVIYCQTNTCPSTGKTYKDAYSTTSYPGNATEIKATTNSDNGVTVTVEASDQATADDLRTAVDSAPSMTSSGSGTTVTITVS